jgi:hypothetical protein
MKESPQQQGFCHASARVKPHPLLQTFSLLIFAIFGRAALATDLPDGAKVLDPNLLWDLEPDTSHVTDIQNPAFVISPDDKRIAYISRGSIWSCDVTSGPPTRLVDLPGSKTEILARPEFGPFWQSVLTARNSIQGGKYDGRFFPSATVHSLAWTASQDGIVYVLTKGTGERPWTVDYRVINISNLRSARPITEFKRDAYHEPHHLYSFFVTRDLRYVVASNGYQPLIIDIKTGKPRATPFDCIIPSQTSGSFLGIEIDTRQLVIADADFNVTSRFDVTCTPRRNIDLVWSSDERYAVVREYLEHPSSDRVGFRFDLKTGERRELNQANKAEQLFFTGNGGELVRTGAFPTVFGDTYVSIIPDGSGPEHEVVRWPNTQQLDPSPRNGRYPAVRSSRDSELFAVAFLRGGRVPGYQYNLVNRQGQKWPCGPDDMTRRVSPYHVVAIANAGKTLVACNDNQLFAIPVETIKNGPAPASP